MTEILEIDYSDDIEPDHWAGVIRHYDPLPQQELDQLKAEYFLNGGVATWVPPQRLVAERKHFGGYYYPDAPKEVKPRIMTRPVDDPEKVERVEQWLQRDEPTSRREMYLALNMSDTLVVRILRQYFLDDPRAQHYIPMGQAALDAKRLEEDMKLRDKILFCVEHGQWRTRDILKTTGLTDVMFRRIVDKFNIRIKQGGTS